MRGDKTRDAWVCESLLLLWRFFSSGCKNEHGSSTGKPDLSVRGTRLEQTQAVLTGQLVRSFVCSLLVGGNRDVDQELPEAVVGCSSASRLSHFFSRLPLRNAEATSTRVEVVQIELHHFASAQGPPVAEQKENRHITQFQQTLPRARCR